ncbi:MAG: AAA domain-containing protein, partial [Cyclonatronaceae bacterium]
DVLTDGKRAGQPDGQEVLYRFETTNPSLRFAEECRATLPGKSFTVSPVDVTEQAITFRFPEDCGEEIAELELEWENDFVLRRIQESLMHLVDSVERRDRIKRMIHPAQSEIAMPELPEITGGPDSPNDFSPSPPDKTAVRPAETEKSKNAGKRKESGKAAAAEKPPGTDDIREDCLRNRAQREAIYKAMVQPVSYIWGPPGTGKTATLAYIMANYVLRGKTVLFVSNTNRAVDNGMLGLMDAMETLNLRAIPRRITRFGERILENERLDSIHFEQQLEEMMRSRMQEAADLQHWLDALSLPDLTPQQKKHIEDKIERMGGADAVEEQIREITQKERHAFVQLRRFRVVGTTLARVCTSDMLESMEFDAVVVDEASMASIPYMLVMASKAREHLVVVGDPMQLPPIAITEDAESREMLEQDLFAAVSGAKTTGELFQWHDDHPGFTSFFNIQYRMQSDLAEVISEVFYEGRLLSAPEMEVKQEYREDADSATDNRIHPKKRSASGSASGSGPDSGSSPASEQGTGPSSVTLLDSSPMGPVLTQDTRRRGFQPINEVHMALLTDLIRELLTVQRFTMRDIGIIVPFRSTVWHLRRELRGKNRWYDLEIGTIHTFQGREKRAIILDTVMSGEMRTGRVQHYSVRPFDEAKNGLSVPRLLNVAFSRSKEQLVVVADMAHIQRVYGRKFLGRLLARLPVR